MIDQASTALHLVRLDIDAAAGLSEELVQRLAKACDDVEDAAVPAALVLRFRGTSMPQEPLHWPGSVNLEWVNRWEKAMRRFERLQGVSLACVEGVCPVSALDLLLAVDQRIATSTASISLHGGEGAWPGMAMWRMSARHGLGAARSVFLFETQLTCARLAQLGVVDHISDDADGAIAGWLASLAGVDMQVLSSRRLLLLETSAHSYDQALGQHLAACDVELRRRQSLASQHAQAKYKHDAAAHMVSA